MKFKAFEIFLAPALRTKTISFTLTPVYATAKSLKRNNKSDKIKLILI